MAAILHEISSRSKRDAAAPALFSDFVLGQGRSVGARVALDEPGWFPYCADGRQRRVMFLRTGEDVDLSKVPFVYHAQFEEARYALVMSFEDLEELAASVPTPQNIIFLFSIGRCGSTLTAQVLSTAAATWSLSEPDIYAGIAMTREDFSADDVDLVISAGTRLLFAPASARGYSTLSVKLRSQSLFQARDFHRCFPNAKFLFLYRDPEAWAKSFYHFVQSLGYPIVLDADGQRLAWRMVSGNADPAYLSTYFLFPQKSAGFYKLLAPAWMRHLQEYLDCLTAGVPFQAIRYESYKNDEAGVVGRISAHCDVEIPDGSLTGVFERQSQSGTFLDVARSEDNFSPSQEEYLELLKRSPRFAEVKALVAGDGLLLR